ncbi:MAG: OmpA family protein [Polyangiaceae bacterium]
MATPTSQRRLRCIGLASLTALPLLFVSQFAQAQQPGFAVNRFDPAEKGSDWFVAESLDFRGKFRPALGIVGEWATKEMVFYNFDDSTKARFIEHQAYFHLGGSLVLWDRLRLGANIPLAIYQTGESTTVNGTVLNAPEKAAIGDVRLGADVRLFGAYREAIEGAIGVQVHLPTGSQNLFTGDGQARIVPRLMFAGDIADFAYSLRAGYEFRGRSDAFAGRQFGDEITGAFSIGVRLFEKKLLVGPEFYGSTLASDAFQDKNTPSEVLFGAHYTYNDFKFGAGLGSGLTRAFGSPQVRAILGFEWTPAIDEAKPDRDGDGILDKDDVCPDTPGVVSHERNGCPPIVPPPVVVVKPSDRDNDGIADTEDACPDVAGVKTDDPKTNGCPSDKDKDGIADSEDACIDVAGIRTDDPKTNGCPPNLDRDKDGIANDVDACPDEPGPKSDDPKTNGCPRVFIKNSQIQILEQPKFDFGKAAIKKESDSLLTEVAKVMADHPEIKLVKIEGHTDNVGNAAVNKKLSEQRAQSVANWLIAHGSAKDRFAAVGIGKDRPLVSNATDAGRAQNRRVEFHIEDQATTSKEMVKLPEGGSKAAPPATLGVPEGAKPTPPKDIPKKNPKP